MNPKRIAIASIAAIVVVALLVWGGRYAAKVSAEHEAAEDERNREETCEMYLDKKLAVLVKDCLDHHRLATRRAEAEAVLSENSNSRDRAIARLDSADPTVLAMMKRWAAAKKADPTLFIDLHVDDVDRVLFHVGEGHSSAVSATEIMNDMMSALKSKLPGVTLTTSNGSCDAPATDLRLSAKVTVHEGSEMTNLTSPGHTVSVHLLEYDVEVVACYDGERATIADIKGRTMLPSGFTATTADPSSAAEMAYDAMDRSARFTVQGIFEHALGI